MDQSDVHVGELWVYRRDDTAWEVIGYGPASVKLRTPIYETTVRYVGWDRFERLYVPHAMWAMEHFIPRGGAA